MIERINIDDFFKKQPNTETRFCDLCLVINKLADNLNHIEQEMWTDEKKFFELSDLVVANGNKIAKLRESVQGVVDNSIKDGAYIQNLEEDVKALRADVDHILNYCPMDLVEKLPENRKFAKNAQTTQNSTNNVKNSHLFQGNKQKDHKIRSTNERWREALSLAENALIRIANDACCMDEHIYIDGILNQIERITKGGKDE